MKAVLRPESRYKPVSKIQSSRSPCGARQLEALQGGLVQRRLGEGEAHERVLMEARHRLQHFRRRHAVESAQRLQRGGEGIAMRAAGAVRPVERRGDRRAFGQYLTAPLEQLDFI